MRLKNDSGAAMSDQHPDCVYELCGCGASADGHCMICLKPIIEHRLIPKPELEELHRRFQYYDAQLTTATEQIAEVTAERDNLKARIEYLEDQLRQRGQEGIDW